MEKKEEEEKHLQEILTAQASFYILKILLAQEVMSIFLQWASI